MLALVDDPQKYVYIQSVDRNYVHTHTHTHIGHSKRRRCQYIYIYTPDARRMICFTEFMGCLVETAGCALAPLLAGKQLVLLGDRKKIIST